MRARQFIIEKQPNPQQSPSMLGRVLKGLGLGPGIRKQDALGFFSEKQGDQLDDVIQSIMKSGFTWDSMKNDLHNWFDKTYGPVNPNFQQRFHAYLDSIVDMLEYEKGNRGPKYQNSKDAFLKTLYYYQQDAQNKLTPGAAAVGSAKTAQSNNAPAATASAPATNAPSTGTTTKTASQNYPNTNISYSMPNMKLQSTPGQKQAPTAPAAAASTKQPVSRSPEEIEDMKKRGFDPVTGNRITAPAATAAEPSSVKTTSATPAGKKRTGGRVKGYLSTNPRAVARRNATAAKRAAKTGTAAPAASTAQTNAPKTIPPMTWGGETYTKGSKGWVSSKNRLADQNTANVLDKAAAQYSTNPVAESIIDKYIKQLQKHLN